MAQTMTADAAATKGKSLPARVAGVIFSPRATYADVAARPRVLGLLAVVMLVIVAATFTFLSTEVGQQASLDNQVRQMEAFGRGVSDTRLSLAPMISACAGRLGHTGVTATTSSPASTTAWQASISALTPPEVTATRSVPTGPCRRVV